MDQGDCEYHSRIFHVPGTRNTRNTISNFHKGVTVKEQVTNKILKIIASETPFRFKTIKRVNDITQDINLTFDLIDTAMVTNTNPITLVVNYYRARAPKVPLASRASRASRKKDVAIKAYCNYDEWCAAQLPNGLLSTECMSKRYCVHKRL